MHGQTMSIIIVSHKGCNHDDQHAAVNNSALHYA